ncbi:hypothetical protein JZ751_006371 [Albula glossodonta]|uniref:Mitochondrial genome maintenance exonuclease 1 n=1 Tax=Albula glossodonta TaxID=121402 RepID=A0A8T2N8B7_9TELE|nr:hypothetical protein JZ751_006371 [Albula glossodonta]
MRFNQLFNRVRHTRLVTGLFPLTGASAVALISTSCPSNARKKDSQYGSVDTEKYSSLVRSVVSSRVSCQTPASLEEEDEHIYGPVVKSKPPTERPAAKAPKKHFPLVANPGEISDPKPEAEEGPPTRIALQRGAGRGSTPSVTRILQQTMPPEQAFYLERWKQRMIAELGEEGFKDAEEYMGGFFSDIFRQGKQFHSALESVFMPDSAPAEEGERSEAVEGYMESISHVLEDIGGVRAIESVVTHQPLGYLGLVDCVAQYRWVSLHKRPSKTILTCLARHYDIITMRRHEKPKPYLHNTYDNPLQVAAYIGALNSDSNYAYQVESGLIVVAYKDGSPAHPHFMTSDLCQQYWKKWLLRLEEFVEKKK